MRNSFEGFLIRLIVAALVAWFGLLYFGIVLPRPAASTIALILALAELFAPMLAGKQGASLRVMFQIAMPLVAWPALAWLAEIYLTNHGVAVALAAAAASMLGVAAAGHGQGKEHARLAVVFVATAIPPIALYTAMRGGNEVAAAVACVAVAAGFISAKLAIVWPDHIENAMVGCALAAAAAGGATAIPAIFFS